MGSFALKLIPLFPLLGFCLNGLMALCSARGKVLNKKWVSLVACLAPLAAFIFSLGIFRELFLRSDLIDLHTGPIWEWMAIPNALVLSFGFSADRLTAVMLLIITGIGSLIHLYSVGYMEEDEGYARYMAYLNLFIFFMLLLVLGDSLPLLFVGWEGVGLCSYCLIGFWYEDPEKAAAGKKAFIVNRIGDFAFLIAMFLIVAILSQAVGNNGEVEVSTRFLNFDYIALNVGQLAAQLNGGLASVTVITLLLFIAATGKSAQIPLYIWLPDAMAGPTPVSALIHAATMVTAGIFMIAKLYFLFVLAPLTLDIIATVGAATACMAALIAITQHDIKKVLAYSTVSQLGFMFLALGSRAPVAAVFHVMTHAFFKACLFLGSGSVIHGMHHEQDIRKMGGLWGRMPITALTFLVATLAIAGIPPLSGFFSKDEILFYTYNNVPRFIYYTAFFTAGLTAFYMTRLFVYVFLGKTRCEHPEHIHESPWTMWIPLVVLAVLSAIGGLFNLPHPIAHLLHVDWGMANGLSHLGQVAPHGHESSEQELLLMGVSAFWALFCVGAAYFLYKRDLNWTRKIKTVFAPIHKILSNKFYIDEIYNFIFVRPLHFISEKILFRVTDVGIIDGLIVNGAAVISGIIGRVLSLFQTGALGNYILYFVVILSVILALMTWKI